MLNGERDRIFGEWLSAHKGTLFKVVRAYAFEHADRQDLFQEVAVQVWRSVDAYRGDSSVRTWMYRIALNAAISWTRKQDRHQRGKQPLEIVDGLLAASAEEADPRVDWLYRQIAQLKDVDRSVALLMLDQPTTFSARLIVWDYVVGGIGLAAAVTIAGALFALRRSHQARERGFGDSVRDHLRRRIAHLDAEVTGERRLALTMVAAMLICAVAISIVAGRIKHVPVPWNDIIWPSPFSIVLILGFLYLLLFRWAPRERQHNLLRKRQLEALLKELDGH